MARYTALIIEDFKGFSRFVLLTLLQKAEFQVVYQASDGLKVFSGPKSCSRI